MKGGQSELQCWREFRVCVCVCVVCVCVCVCVCNNELNNASVRDKGLSTSALDCDLNRDRVLATVVH